MFNFFCVIFYNHCFSFTQFSNVCCQLDIWIAGWICRSSRWLQLLWNLKFVFCLPFFTNCIILFHTVFFSLLFSISHFLCTIMMPCANLTFFVELETSLFVFNLSSNLFSNQEWMSAFWMMESIVKVLVLEQLQLILWKSSALFVLPSCLFTCLKWAEFYANLFVLVLFSLFLFYILTSFSHSLSQW